MTNIYEFKVYFGDTDAAGIVYYPNYYRWMDQASHEYLAAKNLSISKLQSERSVTVPLLEALCQFKSPLVYEDIVEVHSTIVEVKNKVFKIEHEFQRNSEIIATGYELRAWAKIGEEKMKAISIPEDVVNIFGLENVGE